MSSSRRKLVYSGIYVICAPLSTAKPDDEELYQFIRVEKGNGWDGWKSDH
jgi:hypothetical protein